MTAPELAPGAHDGDGSIRVYVNERGVSVPAGSAAIDAVRVLFPDHASDLAAGTARLTDSRGLPVDASVVLHGGAIFRVLPVRDRPDPAE